MEFPSLFMQMATISLFSAKLWAASYQQSEFKTMRLPEDQTLESSPEGHFMEPISVFVHSFLLTTIARWVISM